MLPDFRIPVTLETADGLRPKAVIARDLPLWAFLYGGDPEKLHRPWLDALLIRAVVEPRLSPELVARLGEYRTEPQLAYLLAVGYLEADDLAKHAERGWYVGRASEVASWAAAELVVPEPTTQAVVGLPLDAVMGPEHLETAQLLAQISDRTHVPPHVIWRTWTVSEFFLTARVLRSALPTPMLGVN